MLLVYLYKLKIRKDGLVSACLFCNIGEKGYFLRKEVSDYYNRVNRIRKNILFHFPWMLSDRKYLELFFE